VGAFVPQLVQAYSSNTIWAATRLARRIPNPATFRSPAQGEIRSQVNNGPVTAYKAGESFSELPGDRHGFSANATEKQPAKLLAVFVVDTNISCCNDVCQSCNAATFASQNRYFVNCALAFVTRFAFTPFSC
jgi:hypothetical protein